MTVTEENGVIRRYAPDDLAEFAGAALAALGATPEIAAEVAGSLVLSNLVGHDSHGVIRLDQYSGWVSDGQIRPAAAPRVERRLRATAVVDGGWGFGQPAAKIAAGLASELATEYGAAAVTIRDCNHIGRLGEYVADLADAGLVGLAFCNSGAVVAPFGGTGRALGTNPFAWAAPGGPAGALVLDFSTAGVAEGKLRVADAEGRPLEPGLIVDVQGRPSTRPADFYAGGALLPFGGHKGSGMCVMIEVLGGLLTGMGTACTPSYAGGNGAVLIAADVAAFAEPDAYLAGALEFGRALAAVGAGPSGGTVMLPGEVEHRTRELRAAKGVPMSAGVLDVIYGVTDPLGVPRLEPLPEQPS